MMDWKSIVGAVAPTVATALGGPLAGLAVESLGKALGIDQPTVKKVEDALTQGQLTGDQIAQIKQAELALQTRMRELEISEEHLYETDRDSARKREASVQDKTPRNLAYLIVLGGGCMIGFTLAGVTKVDSVLAGTLIGYAVSEMKQVLNYYFGSSQGSADKTQLLAQKSDK